MGSCSFKEKTKTEQAINVVAMSQNVVTSEEDKKSNLVGFSQRAPKIKNKGPLLEIRKGSISGIDAPTAQVKDKVKTLKDLEMIEKAFQHNFIFNTLSQEQKKSIIDCMKYYTLTSNQIIFKQGQPGNNFFLIVSGIVEVIVNDARINTLLEGNGFGEIALMHDTPRTATIRTLTPVVL